MYHANFLTLFIQKKFYDKLFWNIRHSELNFKISKKLTIFLSIICGIFSKLIPKKIIYCSERSIKFHENNHFYFKNKSILIYNGCNEKNYYSSKYLRSSFRKKNKIKKTDIILGYAGRYAKQKNIPALLYAFSKIKKNYDNIYLYMVGKNINFKNKKLLSQVKNQKIKNRLFFLNEQKSLLKFYNGIDLLILPSLSESFPNVIPESMLCSTPVLSTNAGCSKTIIGKYGFIIAKNSKQTISSKLDKVIKYYVYKKKEWALLKKNSRIQIKKNFSISNMANKYVQHWIS
jgi:glycosyltransferase involved in cell wall biosynthesis